MLVNLPINNQTTVRGSSSILKKTEVEKQSFAFLASDELQKIYFNEQKLNAYLGKPLHGDVMCKTSDEDAQKATSELKELASKWKPNLEVTLSDPYGEKEMVVSYLGRGASRELRFGKYDSDLLVWASRSGNECVFSGILENFGWDINSQNAYGTTALMNACRYGYKQIVKDCVKYNADVNLQCMDGDAAVHSASRHGQLECLTELYYADADFMIRNKKGQTPFDVALDDRVRRHISGLLEKMGYEKQEAKQTTEERVRNQLASARSELDSIRKL